MCLEEMLGTAIPAGALFYGTTRRRLDVALDSELRRRTEEAAARLHELFARGATPPARYEKRCENCSLAHLCLPKAAGKRGGVEEYLRRMLTHEETA